VYYVWFVICDYDSFAGQLSVNFQARSNKGEVYVSVHSNVATFPMKAEEVSIKAYVLASENVVIIKDIPNGEYAVAIYHDENSNGKLDTGWFGIPAEGVGASNNKASFGPPSYKDALFKIDSEEKRIIIDIKYL